MHITNVTKENFNAEVVQAEQTVLLDFWAEWCGPCRMISPVIESFAEQNGSVKVCKINVDEAGELAALHGIDAIPTLVIYRQGKEINRHVGFCDASTLSALIAE